MNTNAARRRAQAEDALYRRGARGAAAVASWRVDAAIITRGCEGHSERRVARESERNGNGGGEKKRKEKKRKGKGKGKERERTQNITGRASEGRRHAAAALIH